MLMLVCFACGSLAVIVNQRNAIKVTAPVRTVRNGSTGTLQYDA